MKSRTLCGFSPSPSRKIRDLRSCQDSCPRSCCNGLALSREDRGSKPLFQRRRFPCTLHCGRQRFILANYSNPFSQRRNGPSPRRQGERQYNQPGQKHARYKRKRCVQWVRLEMAASLCSPVHRGPHGSLLPTDTIIYPRKARSASLFALKPCKIRDPLLMKNPRPNYAEFESRFG